MGIWDEPVKEAEVVPEPHGVIPVVGDPGKVKTESFRPEFKGLPVRSGGDRIWLLKGGKKHWITNKETFEKLGFKFGDEREIDLETLQALVEGEPLR